MQVVKRARRKRIAFKLLAAAIIPHAVAVARGEATASSASTTRPTSTGETGETKEAGVTLIPAVQPERIRIRRTPGSYSTAAQVHSDIRMDDESEEYEPEEYEAVVFDNSSYMFKAGFGGDDAPQTFFPTIVGHPKHPGIFVGMKREPKYIGNEAWSKRGVLHPFVRPIERRIITNWDEMEKIWHHAFYSELRVDPQEHPVHLTEPLLNPKANRERMTQIMFETFNVPSMYVCLGLTLSMYSSGRTTAVVVDSGWKVTSVVSVYEGITLPHTAVRIDLGGHHITEYMMKNLNLNKCRIEIVRDIKENYCHVSMNYHQEMQEQHHQKTISYAMPDGNEIDIQPCIQFCPEILFNPYLNSRMNDFWHVLPSTRVCVALLSARHKRLGEKSLLKVIPSFLLRKCLLYIPNTNTGYGGRLPEARLHHAVFNAINECDVDIRNILYANIVLSGGNTMFAGIKERLTKEIETLSLNKEMKVEVICTQKNSA